MILGERYLLDPPAGRLSHGWALLGTLTFAAVAVALAGQHSVWRDEVRAMNIASACASPLSLVACLRNEGHPALWYFLLHLGYRLTGSFVALKATSVAVAIASAYLVLRHGPFRPLWKVLFLAGYFPLLEYAARCRNYGIGMLLLFAFAAAYCAGRRRTWLLALILALLANSNAFGLVLALALFAGLMLEHAHAALSGRDDGEGRPISRTRLACGLGVAIVVLGGAYLSIVTAMPDRSTTVTPLHQLSAGQWAVELLGALAWPTRFANLKPDADSPLLLTLGATAVNLLALAGFWLILLQLLSRPWKAASLYVAAVGCSLLDVLYTARTRHLGQFLIFLIVLLWTDAVPGPRVALPAGLTRLLRRTSRLLHVAAVTALVFHAGYGVIQVGQELMVPYSHCRSLGKFLNAHPELGDAILVGEPDYLIEALPYYAPVRMYNARERAFFVDRINFTSAGDPDLSLDELLARARELRRQFGKPILLVIGHALNAQGPFTLQAGLRGVFHYAPESLRTFERQATRLAVFTGSQMAEDFTLYALAESFESVGATPSRL